MNESTGKTTSCLAITEKRPHRPGGCVGIFFQLFDWNRRFAKKKLFSKTLLPPARAKQSSKKFRGEEKMPKTKSHLIADENSRGFPNVKKNGSRSDNTEQKHEMRAAGLVARLMGLESLPAVHRGKHKKLSKTPPCDVREEKFVNSHSGSDMEVVNLEKGSSKIESRPQKLQKTGQFERRAVTKFGAEALQIRNVLSRARKHHHPKLASPVKSPRISSSRNVSRASRLIDAATRILEPGLHATSRAKCALTYSSSTNYVPKNEVLMDAMGLGVVSPDILKQHRNDVNYNMGVDKSLMGQTSCKNCGDLLDVVDSKPNVEEQPFVCQSSAANVPNNSLQGLERIKPRPTNSSPEQERDVAYHRNQVQSAERLDSTRACSELISDRKPVSSEGQMSRQLKSQQCRPQKDQPSSIAFRQRTEIRNEMSVAKGRIPPRAKLNNLQSRRASSAANAITGAKDFVALNRSLSSRTRPRVSNKADNYVVDKERKFCSRRDDSLSQLRTPVRKRRTVSVNAQLDSTGLVDSTSMRQKNVKCDFVSGKELEHNASTADRESIKTRSAIQGEGHRTSGNSKDDILSFTFSPPLRHKNFVSSGLKDMRDHIDKNTSQPRKLPSDESDGQTSLQRQVPLRGDTLGALLEQKLKELISQEEEELTNGGAIHKRSTAMILQELISALTSQQPFSPDGHMVNAETTFQTEGRVGGTSVGFSHDGDHHLSPGSVLEAPFSNDSCFSSSLDDSSGRRLLSDSMDYSCDMLQPIEIDTDLLDSATSRNGCTSTKIVTDLLNRISRILLSIDLADGLTGSRLTYAKEVILDSELLFGSAAQRNSDRMKSFLRGPITILFGELETHASASWTNFNALGFEESKEGSKDSQVKRFLFDCVIECFDSKYSRYCNSGFKAWRGVPLCMNAEMLIEEVGKEIRRWTNLAGMIPDEIIEWEMSHSLGKWTDFEIESFETGSQIDWDILQVLVDELVTDFCGCRLGYL
ncbi:hypothetical protein P3X46_016229 [Hevea brasiliensis]|uniref:DUF4378 domain-containing protein n=1 Tax=Hevea brasiliensis TaxID=3981 RepID=A0ABQ9M0C0_HEVBR|nr:uncharacterized protein LOC110661125 [Hevea brasiliensis]KAJ9173053.1 hypothetical protein P3X46_016229 [Hevea brasiliensis]